MILRLEGGYCPEPAHATIAAMAGSMGCDLDDQPPRMQEDRVQSIRLAALPGDVMLESGERAQGQRNMLHEGCRHGVIAEATEDPGQWRHAVIGEEFELGERPGPAAPSRLR